MKNRLLSFCLLFFLIAPTPSFAQEPEPCDSCVGYPAGSYMRSGGPELGGAVYKLSCQSGTWENISPLFLLFGLTCFADCTLDGQTVVYGASHTFYSAEESADCASISQSRTCTHHGQLDGSASYQYASCVVDPCAASSPARGTECSDGTFYIGLSPADGTKVYMTSAAHEGSGIQFDSASCSFCGDGSVATSQTDGRANTNALLAFNATGFDAANHCEGLNATSAHGHTDWYLPAGGQDGSSSEINLIWLTVQSAGGVGGLDTSGNWYWSSSEFDSSSARIQRFSDGIQYDLSKNYTNLVRCVRR